MSSAETPAGGVRHVVKDKETLSVIAQNYGVTVNAIVTANQLKSANFVRVGQVLIFAR